MAKRFKLRMHRLITATLQSCRSKDPSILPEDPVPSFSPLKSNGQNHVTSALIFNKQTPDDVVNKTTSTVEFKWQKQDKWHVVAANIYAQPKPRLKICSSSEDDLSFPPPAPPPSAADEKKRRARKKKKKKKMKNNVPSRLRISTSSVDSGWFSSEGGGTIAASADDEETEKLVSSSLSFSTDSSSKRRVSKRGVLRPAAEAEIPARLSVFKKLIPCTVEGKVKESFAIVKRSEDPYEDFKNSMMEMILEKHMFDPKDLEQLLQCFLSLNSRRYHGIIVQAFSEIWEGIFSHPSDSKQNQRRVSRLALSI